MFDFFVAQCYPKSNQGNKVAARLEVAAIQSSTIEGINETSLYRIWASFHYCLSAILCQASFKKEMASQQHPTMREVAEEWHERIRPWLLVQHGNARIPNTAFFNSFLRIAENGRKRRSFPERYGKWGSVHSQVNERVASGMLDRLLKALREEYSTEAGVERLGLDRIFVKVHLDGMRPQTKLDRTATANRAADIARDFRKRPPGNDF